MPTFNQLVRKGREQATYQVYRSGSAEGYQHSEESSYGFVLPPEERRLHGGQNYDPQEAELCAA